MRQVEANPNWYVIYTRPKFEKNVCRYIDYLNIEPCRYQSYLPIKMVMRRWSDRMKKIEEPLFSCYVFVQTEIKYRAELLQIPGVIRFLSGEKGPSPISTEEIERIRLIESGPGEIQRESYFAIGDRVRVTRGIFASMEGMLIKQLNKGPRFLIRLPLLQQAVSVEIGMDDIQKIV